MASVTGSKVAKMRVKWKRIIPLIGLVVSFCINLIILRVWQGASGLDIYYYALQTKALTIAGAQLFWDFSPVYRVLWALNGIFHNPILCVQILSSCNIALLYFCFLTISLRGGFSLYKTAAATIAIFNPATFYFMLEFTKNSFAIALFFLAWILVTNYENKMIFKPKTVRSALRLILGLLFFALSASSHRMMLALFLCFLCHKSVIYFWYQRQREMKNVIIATACIVLVAFVAVSTYLRDMIAERLSVLSLDAPLHRLTQFIHSDLLTGEHIFYIVLQVAVFFLVPFIVIIRKQYLKPEAIFAGVAWLFLFPFLSFGWDEVGFRLLLLATIMLAPWLISLDSDKQFLKLGIKISTITAGILFAASIFFAVESAQNLAIAKGPNYRQMGENFTNIENLAKGRRLIVHRGLAGWLWYEKGIRSENFLPVGEHEKYLRVVYAFSPDILQFYLEPDDPPPVPIGNTYTLVEEYIWQRFYQDRSDLYFLKSEMNPFLPRPQTAFAINEKVSSIISPVSDPP